MLAVRADQPGKTAGGAGPAATLRLFVAIELPEEWRRWLARQQERLEQASPGYARWVAPETFHLTLVFIGPYNSARLEALRGALEAAARRSPRLTLRLERLGTFGPAERPRVIWASVVDPTDRLARLQQAVAQAVRGLGVEVDERPFAPHLTLGRARESADPQAGRQIVRALAPAEPPPGTAEVREITLFRSELRRGGARYTPLARFALAGEE